MASVPRSLDDLAAFLEGPEKGAFPFFGRDQESRSRGGDGREGLSAAVPSPGLWAARDGWWGVGGGWVETTLAPRSRRCRLRLTDRRLCATTCAMTIAHEPLATQSPGFRRGFV